MVIDTRHAQKKAAFGYGANNMKECFDNTRTKTIVLNESTRILYKDYEIDLDRLIKSFGKRAIFRDSNGIPIGKNDIVYGMKDGKAWIVKDIIGGSYPVDAVEYTRIGEALTHELVSRQLKPEWLTHKPLDTQEKINADARKDANDYWCCIDKGIDCENCDKRLDCETELKLDLLHRQRELDKRMMN